MVYSGGASKGAYQIGFTKALLNYIDRDEIKMVSGASIGIFSAYALSANKLEEYEFLFKNINIKNPIKLFIKVFANKYMQKVSDCFIDKKDCLQIPLCFPISFLPFLNVNYYWMYGDVNYMWKKYILAGAQFPFFKIFPSKIEKRLAIDGGASDNIPIFPLLQKKSRPYIDNELDLIIVLHFDSKFDYRKDFDVDIPILELDLTISNKFKGNHFDFSTEYVNEMIEKGYEYGVKISERIFRNCKGKEEIQKEINDIFIEERSLRLKNISADRLVSILNSTTKIIKKNNCIKYIF